MAFIRDDERLRKLLEKQPVLGQPATISGVMPSAPQNQVASMASSTGTRAPLLADYLRANVGSGMAEKTVGALEKQANAIQSSKVSTSPTGEITVAMETGAKGLSPAQQTVVGRGVGFMPGKGVGTVAGTKVGEMSTGPVGFAPTKAILTAPQAQQRAEAIESQARAVVQPGGAQSLLQAQYGQKQGYTQGEQLLDAALLGATSGGRLEQLSKKYSGLYGQLSDKINRAKGAYEDEQIIRNAGRTSVRVSPDEMADYQAWREAEKARKLDVERAAAAETSRQRMKLSPSDSTRAVSEDILAARKGMTLEEWIKAGRP
jgi:hypothetical protein